jgi:tocopherol cyclase
MEHFAPHPKSRFEGFYSKFDLPSGSHVALVICTVPNATKLPPHMVSFTYYPASGSPIFQREHWVSNIERVLTGSTNAFELITDFGSMRVAPNGDTTYDLDAPEWSLHATTTSRTAWFPGQNSSTPEGWLVHLPLPLHWHVHSLSSQAEYHLKIPSQNVDQKDTATVHQEKNWANSFPAAHTWVQARDPHSSSGICLAGGKILGMHAFLLGYRSPKRNLDFLPPFALAVPIPLPFFSWMISPFMTHIVDYPSRSFSLTVCNLFYKIEVTAQAPKESGWFGLGSPFPEGHRKNFCSESFLATVDVVVWERSVWKWAWTEVERERYQGSSLEFAGEYFPGRGKKEE